jgi:repressor LexA
MVDLYKKIITLCEQKGVSPTRMSLDLGFSKNFMSELKSGRAKSCSATRLKQLAEYFDVSVDYFSYDFDTLPETRIPVYGTVPAGIPLTAIEDIIDYEEITPAMASRGKYAALKIKGDSMMPLLINGDVAIIRLQEDADSEDIVIAMINGDESTCKKLKKDTKGIWLMPLNPAYEPMFFSNKQILVMPVRLLGVVVEIRRTLKR